MRVEERGNPRSPLYFEAPDPTGAVPKRSEQRATRQRRKTGAEVDRDPPTFGPRYRGLGGSGGRNGGHFLRALSVPLPISGVGTGIRAVPEEPANFRAVFRPAGGSHETPTRRFQARLRRLSRRRTGLGGPVPGPVFPALQFRKGPPRA